MRTITINDFMKANRSIRVDGHVMRDMYKFQVKAPVDSSGEWDLYKLLSTIPAQDAFRELPKGSCKYQSESF